MAPILTPYAPNPTLNARRDIISQVMDELMGETTRKMEKAPSSIPQPTQDTKLVEEEIGVTTGLANMTPKKSHGPCGNERYMKNAAFFKTCTKGGVILCPTCRLIEYCSDKCRFEHLETHRPFCNPAFACEHWAPDMSTPEDVPDETDKPLTDMSMWGKVPATDILSTEDPSSYFQDVNLLMPISGDLRHAIKTVTSLPCDYKKTCDITMNDPNTIIVIRNALILMITFIYPNKYEASRAAMHLWYSAVMKEKTWKKIKFELLPFVERAYAKNMKGKATSQVSQRWTKGAASLRLTLTRRQWKQMIDILTNGENIDPRQAMASRRAVIADPKEELRRNQKLYNMPVAHRRSHVRYLNTGLLLPFGQAISAFEIPNPTLFDAAGTYLNPSSDNTPLDAWALDDVLAAGTRSGVLPDDLYAALSQHVSSTLFDFCVRLADLKHRVNFHLYSVETRRLDGTLGNNKRFHANGLRFLQVGGYGE